MRFLSVWFCIVVEVLGFVFVIVVLIGFSWGLVCLGFLGVLFCCLFFFLTVD